MKNYRYYIYIVLFGFLSFQGSQSWATDNELKLVLIEEGLTAEQANIVAAGLLKPYSTAKAKETIAWLRMQGVQRIGAVLVKLPVLLGYSVPQRLQKRVEWLKRLGVQNVTKVITDFPAIFGYSTEKNLNLKIQWLKLVGFNHIGAMVDDFPPLLGLSLVDNLDPTLKVLTSKSKWNLPISLIEKQPRLLGSSLARLRKLSEFLDLLAALNSRTSFPLNQLSESRRVMIVQSVSAEIVLENLKAAQVIHGDRTLEDLMETQLHVLSHEELLGLVEVFRNKDWDQILVPRGKITDRAIYFISGYCQKVLK